MPNAPVALPRNLIRAAFVGREVGQWYAALTDPLTLSPEKRLIVAMDTRLTDELSRSDLDPEDADVWDAAAGAFLLALIRNPISRSAVLGS